MPCGKCERTIYENDWAGYSEEEKGVIICAKCCQDEDEDGN